ncbi:hypothetical protein VTN77DRAFT_9537 [Rasamsonia byssochlamydoides]|uniref:uncharacterized protein n=1 Tax=Rasamsonia byssochlamydoides TaxID=89139 RepID=UPI003743963C
MDLLSILPELSTKQYTHILPSLERKHISTVDLITLDTLEIAKRAHVPPADVRRLCADVIEALHRDLGFERQQPQTKAQDKEGTSSNTQNDTPLIPGPSTKLDLSHWSTISTLDPALDALLGGGIPTGYLTEVTGESGSGKTQFLLNLLLTAQLPPPRGLGKRSIYISTEAPLSTTRLSQLLETHPYLSTLPPDAAPSLENILSINAIDLETQDHILNYQLPVAVSRYNVGLVVIDSIAANYRAEHESNSVFGLSTRSRELARLGQMLRNLAAKEDIAVVVANQVSDRFDSLDGQARFRSSQTLTTAMRERESGARSPLPRSRVDGGNTETIPSSSPAPSSPYVEDESFDGAYIIGHPVRNETLSLAHQQRFFTGWGDAPELEFAESQKTPALGFVWSTQIACRIALKKEDEFQLVLDPAATPSSQTRPRFEGTTLQDDLKTSQETNSADPKSTAEQEDQSGQSTTTRVESLTSTPSRVAEKITKRRMKLVFAPWTVGMADNASDEIEFEIWKGGIRSIQKQ